MSISIKASTIDNKTETISIEQNPDYCPLCNRHQEPSFVSAFITQFQNCQIVYRCTNNKCLSFFIAYYHLHDYITSRNYRIVCLRPQNPIGIKFEEEINNVSPLFCEIYKQSYLAESSGYKQVAGCGYRKALEFLIKDYCISRKPEASDEIKRKFLGEIIKTHIDDNTVKACAEKATWLGNDETHYVKQWEDMDIKDLKELLELTKYWIIQKVKTDKYLIKMQNKK